MASTKPMKLCVYCNIREATTMDHVIAQLLFSKPLPNNMITVPCCWDCNQAKKLDDEFLRDMMIVDVENDHHGINAGPKRGSVQRSMRRNQSMLAREIRAKGPLMPKYT